MLTRNLISRSGGLFFSPYVSFCSRIVEHNKFSEYVELEHNGNRLQFGHRWLRDSCRCSSCLDPRTFQRLYDTTQLQMNNDADSISVDSSKKQLNVKWSDGHLSQYKLEWLEKMYNIPSSSPYDVLTDYQIWDSKSFQNGIPQISYKSVIESDEGVKRWIDNIKKYGFGIIGNCPNLPKGDVEASRLAMEKLGNLTPSFYEKTGVWDINVEQNSEKELDHADTAYTNFYLPPHVDGTYFSEPPGLQFFQIPQHDGEGGNTLLVDGFKVANIMETQYPELFDYLSTFPMLFHYFEKGVSFRNSSTVFTLTPEGKYLKFVFNNNDRTPSYVPPEQERFHFDSITVLLKLLNDTNNQLNFRLSPNQLLVTNGWRVLHGRTSFTGNRRLIGGYTAMSEFLGKERLLQGIPPEAQ